MAKPKMKTEEQLLREQISELTAEVARLKVTSEERKTPESYKQWSAAAGFLQSCRQRLASIHESERQRAAEAARQQRMEQLRPKAQAINALSLALAEVLSEFANGSGGLVSVTFSDPNRRCLSLCVAVVECEDGFEIRSQHPIAEVRKRFLRTS